MTAPIWWHASHEQLAPSHLLTLARRAEQAGFAGVATSDHLTPWAPRHQVCGAAWSWLPAVLSATGLPVSVVTTAGWRYPPLVLAQTLATVAEMFPGRLRVALGSGEALNETRIDPRWPSKSVRDEALREHVQQIDGWLHGADDGGPSLVPGRPPPVSVAAVTPRTAAWVGTWWPALITIGDTPPSAAERVAAFRESLGRKGQVTLKVQVSVAPNESRAVAQAVEEWRNPLVTATALSDLRSPEAFEQAAQQIGADQVRAKIPPICSAADLAELLSRYRELEPDLIVVHDVGPRQQVLDLAPELFARLRS